MAPFNSATLPRKRGRAGAGEDVQRLCKGLDPHHLMTNARETTAADASLRPRM